MDLSTSVLGSSVAKWIAERQHASVLRIGKDRFDRAQLAKVECFHFTAAANLSRLLNAELQVKDTRDLFEHVSPDRLVLPRLGAVSLAVLGAAFEAQGIGGSAPLDAWFRKHQDAPITFAGVKRQAARRDALATRKPRRRRSA